MNAVGSTIKYVCSDYPSISNTSTCGSDGQWSVVQLDCSPPPTTTTPAPTTTTTTTPAPTTTITTTPAPTTTITTTPAPTTTITTTPAPTTTTTTTPAPTTTITTTPAPTTTTTTTPAPTTTTTTTPASTTTTTTTPATTTTTTTTTAPTTTTTTTPASMDPPPFTCPPDDTVFRTVLLNDGLTVTYRVFLTSKTYSLAVGICANHGGHLIKVLTTARLDMLQELITTCGGYSGSSQEYYIDGTSDEQGTSSVGAWKTWDGTLIPMGEPFWCPNRPDLHNRQRCLRLIKSTYCPDNIGCSQNIYFICEK